MFSLLWLGAAAAGLMWGWLLGLTSAPVKAPPTSATPLMGLLSRLLRRHAKIRRALRVLLWLIYILAPVAGVYLVAGPESLILFLAAMSLAWWLHRAWLEQLRSRFRDAAGGGR